MLDFVVKELSKVLKYSKNAIHKVKPNISIIEWIDKRVEPIIST